MSLLSIRLWLLGSMTLALALPPLLVRGDNRVQDNRVANAALLSELPVARREHVARNLEAYKRLSEQERARLNGYHEQLDEKTLQGGSRRDTLELYLDWVKSLPPYQREGLMAEPDPQKRLLLVREYFDQQQQARVEQLLERVLERELKMAPDWMRRELARAPKLSSEELATWIASLEQSLLPNSSNEFRTQLESLSGVSRYVYVLGQAQEAGVAWRNVELTKLNIEERFRQTQLGRELENRPDFFRFSQGSSFLLRIAVMASLIRDLELERSAAARPTYEALRQTLKSLPEDEQDRLLSLSAEDMRLELTQALEQQQTRVGAREIAELLLPPEPIRQRFGDMFPGRRPPSWGRPGDGRGPDDREGRGPDGEMRPRPGFQEGREPRPPFGGPNEPEDRPPNPFNRPLNGPRPPRPDGPPAPPADRP